MIRSPLRLCHGLGQVTTPQGTRRLQVVLPFVHSLDHSVDGLALLALVGPQCVIEVKYVDGAQNTGQFGVGLDLP